MFEFEKSPVLLKVGLVGPKDTLKLAQAFIGINLPTSRKNKNNSSVLLSLVEKKIAEETNSESGIVQLEVAIPFIFKTCKPLYIAIGRQVIQAIFENTDDSGNTFDAQAEIKNALSGGSLKRDGSIAISPESSKAKERQLFDEALGWFFFSEVGIKSFAAEHAEKAHYFFSSFIEYKKKEAGYKKEIMFSSIDLHVFFLALMTDLVAPGYYGTSTINWSKVNGDFLGFSIVHSRTENIWLTNSEAQVRSGVAPLSAKEALISNADVAEKNTEYLEKILKYIEDMKQPEQSFIYQSMMQGKGKKAFNRQDVLATIMSFLSGGVFGISKKAKQAFTEIAGSGGQTKSKKNFQHAIEEQPFDVIVFRETNSEGATINGYKVPPHSILLVLIRSLESNSIQDLSLQSHGVYYYLSEYSTIALESLFDALSNAVAKVAIASQEEGGYTLFDLNLR